ncbi:phage baseplate assembly protein [Paraburkholderia bryophila]|uniref:Prophage tail gpP-like protein n=1 Tax=Paraburkholderia bryophila TaxID=420952 RepID=A0A7Z0B4N0_9BURK|nr:Mu P family protein [Paraburkholderia bryophila]NYH21381.1 prophage tail gpP-like protein [Paraburkholderia bryophila]
MDDEITLRVSTCTRNLNAALGQPTYTTSNTRNITGWLGVRLSRGIERCPSDFEVSFTEPYENVSDVDVQEGDQVEVLLGADKVLSGFVDRYLPSYNAREHTIRITGRSKCQDLVDCSAKWTGGQLLNMPLLQIAQTLCGVYGVPVALADGANQGDPIPQLNIMVGEPIYDVLERLCRFRALLLYDQPDGSLLLSGIGTQQAACGFKEGVNVLSASALNSMDGRFSDYDAVRQSLDTCEDIGDGGNLIASVRDATVQRLRYRAIVAESVFGGQDVAAQRAQWEMARRYGRSYAVQVATDSWRDSAGVLWTPNTLVPIDLPKLKLKQQRWLISDVTYKRGADGTTADVVVMPPAAFYQQPIILNPLAPDVNMVN